MWLNSGVSPSIPVNFEKKEALSPARHFREREVLSFAAYSLTDMTFRLFLLACLLAPMFSLAQTNSNENALRLKHFWLDKAPLAIQGYDPVSYYSGKALKGSNKFRTVYKGIEYHFANAKNLETFQKNPAGYEPTYGGWCAYAMGARGEKVEPDPENFKLANGKVYLFYKSFFSNTLDDWNKDEASLKKKADTNWTKILP